jgi:arylsulfatase A-like enzyme
MRSLLRRLLRALRAFCVSPLVVGAIYVVILAVYTGLKSDVVDSDIGDLHRAEAMETFITRRFASEVWRMRVGIVATAFALGIILGLFAEVIARLRGPSALSLRQRRQSAVRTFIHSLGLVAFLHATLVLWAMADTPQLYASRWYAQGGLPRTVQVFATDWLGPRGVVFLSFLIVLAYIRPTRIAYLFRRFFVELRRPLRQAWKSTARKTALASAALLLSLIVAGHELLPIRDVQAAPAAPTTANNKPLNILILAADSLRHDRLDAKYAPNLAKLAARGTRFDRAYVSLPRTFPSWVTILSGRHAHHHGIRSMFPTWEDRAKDFDALPQRFSKAGYNTVVVSDYAGDIFSRIELGFAKVETPSFDFRQMIRQKALERETPLLPVLHSHIGRRLFPVMRELSAAADPHLLSDDIESALRSASKGSGKDAKPFFMTVFFSTAHFPYSAPAPYYNKYTSKTYRGRFKYHKPLGLGRASELPPDADDVRQIQALYDGTVSAVDDGVGRVLKALDKLDLAERTIILVTSDHGETIFDNNHGQGHGDHLFGDEVTHVPLVIYDPRYGVPSKKAAPAEGRHEGRVVRDVDYAPTLYELAGVQPPADLDGRSVAAAVRGEPIDPRFAYAESELWFTEDIPALPSELRMPYPGVMGLTEIDSRHNHEIVLRRDMVAPTLMARHRMVRDERFKLIYIPTRVGVKYMLFDTVDDPSELHDISAAKPNEVTRLKAELWSWMLKDPLMEQKDGYLVPRENAIAQLLQRGGGGGAK